MCSLIFDPLCLLCPNVTGRPLAINLQLPWSYYGMNIFNKFIPHFNPLPDEFLTLSKLKAFPDNKLKVALKILERKFYKNTKKSSLYSQSLLIFIHKTLVVERHLITRAIRDLLRPMSTPMRSTVYFYISISFIYTLKIHRRSFKDNVR